MKVYAPEQVFTEYSTSQQTRLDSLCRVHMAGVRRDRRGELDQIVFRMGGERDLKPGQIFGINDTGNFPCDLLMKVANSRVSKPCYRR